MHIVSNVEGDIVDNMTGADALRACFPAGTVSGAPKVRAMEIIAEPELIAGDHMPARPVILISRAGWILHRSENACGQGWSRVDAGWGWDRG